MKRFISHMLLFILLAMMLAGCSGDAPEVVAEPSTPKPVVSPDDGEIRFKVGTEWQGKGDTRAVLFADADALVTEGSFKVYAYVGATTNAHINGSTASYSEGEWVFTDGKHYWPQSESLLIISPTSVTAPTTGLHLIAQTYQIIQQIKPAPKSFSMPMNEARPRLRMQQTCRSRSTGHSPSYR